MQLLQTRQMVMCYPVLVYCVLIELELVLMPYSASFVEAAGKRAWRKVYVREGFINVRFGAQKLRCVRIPGMVPCMTVLNLYL